jgi:hypothetical protein
MLSESSLSLQSLYVIRTWYFQTFHTPMNIQDECNNTKMDLRENRWSSSDWIDLAQDKGQ